MAFYDLPEAQVEDLKDYRSESKRSADSLADQYTQYNNTPGLIQMDTRPESVTGVDPALMDALNRRTMSKYQKEMSEVKNLAKQQAISDRFSRLESAAKLTAAEHQHNEQVKMAKYMDKMNRRRARGAVLGNILGIAGGVVGGIYGGPAGAMAGYGVGQGVGQMAGSGGAGGSGGTSGMGGA